jgi:predicted acyl esterase
MLQLIVGVGIGVLLGSRPVAAADAVDWRDTAALCTAEQRAAPSASSLGCYRGHGGPVYSEFQRTSIYLPVRDGTRLAVDIYRPAIHGEPVTTPLPVIFNYSRYWRATARRDGTVQTYVGVLGRGQQVASIADALARSSRGDRDGVGLLLSHGYVFVRAEARGTGASFGVRNGDMSGREAKDGRDVIEWIASQPWSTGSVGMIGGSYEGMSQFLVASVAPTGLKAIMPLVATFDEYDASWAGSGMLRKYGLAWLAREARRDGVQKGKQGSTINPLDTGAERSPPVDEDAEGGLRQAALAERLADPEATDPTMYFTRQAPQARQLLDLLAEALGTREPAELMETLYEPELMRQLLNRKPGLRAALQRIKFPRDASAMLTQPQEEGPNNLAMLAPRIAASGIAVYNWGGWRDFATRDTLLWDANVGAARKLTMGPWTHGPNEPNDQREDESKRLRPIEQLRWMDYWLKGSSNGVMSEPRVHYAVQRLRDDFIWTSSPQWPPAGIRLLPWSLRTAGGLDREPGPARRVGFTVDTASTMGQHTRYHDAIGLGPTQHPDLEEHARRGALSFTSPALTADLQIAGSPIVRLKVRSSTQEAYVHAYLEIVEPDGHIALLSDGALRASHRVQGVPPYRNLGLPFSDSRTRVIASTPHLRRDRASELIFDLQPVAARLPAGSKIRLVVTGADAHTNLTLPQSPPTRLTLDLGGDQGSTLLLPTVQD